MNGIPIHAYQPVRVFWGGSGSVIELGTCPMNMVLGFAREWFAENDHFFHLDKFLPTPASGETRSASRLTTALTSTSSTASPPSKLSLVKALIEGRPLNRRKTSPFLTTEFSFVLFRGRPTIQVSLERR